ncbi:uncharacterized protein LOC129912447 isoform X1 [Episyrphus balteatus]|uniref:uncharacterized protein LOC129912447 isoform X1 n=1 Tax=Episyrphus balteatus TaxID=286459 RepID=UPI002485276E|nr:uncharacterized protein LOC129912447 isoform X1 [Episyrphus balteatus]
MNNRRSASVGALPVEKKHFVSRNESASGAVLDVRCACQYFESDSLLPERINPIESRPSSKQGFLSDMEHGGGGGGGIDHLYHPQQQQHFDNMSTRSFNMMGRSREFDKISMAGSFGGRGLVVRSISDATEPEMVGGGGGGMTMMAGNRGRQMSIGEMSGGSFGHGGRDPDAVSIRSGISLRRVSRSPSHADLIVADLNIPTGHVSRGLRRDIPRHITNLPSSSPASGRFSSPEFSKYDKMNVPMSRIQQSHQMMSGENKENENMLPQNKPIDLSMYEDTHTLGRNLGQNIEIPKFNLVAPTPTPTMENTFSPDFTRRNLSPERTPQRSQETFSRQNLSPERTPQRSQETFSRQNLSPERTPQRSQETSRSPMFSADILPQNKPIDVSMYEERGASGTTVDQPMEISNLYASMHGQSVYDRNTSHLEPSHHNQRASEHRAQENVLPQNMPIDVSMYEDHPPRTSTEPNGITNYRNSSQPPPQPSSSNFRGRSPPNVDIYDRKTQGSSGVQAPHQSREEQGNILPQNRPIDVSMYEDNVPMGGGASSSQPMDIEVDTIEAVVEVRDTIRIDRMSPPLQTNVPDLSPKVLNETRIEIRNLAPQPDMRTLDEILADGKQIGSLDRLNTLGHSSTQYSPPQSSQSQQSQLKRQHDRGRGMSPESTKKPLVDRDQSHQMRSGPGMQQMSSDDFRYRGPDIYDVPTQRGSSPAPMRSSQSAVFSSQIFQRAASPGPDMASDRQYGQYESSPIFDRGMSPTRSEQNMQRAVSPGPRTDRGLSPVRSDRNFQRGSSTTPSTHKEDRQYSQYESSQNTQRGMSPSRLDSHYTDTRQHLRRASPPGSSFHTETMQTGHSSYQRASSPVPMDIQQMEPRQLLQRGSPQGVSFKRQTPGERASSPQPQSFQRASSPQPQSFQRASSPPPGQDTMKAGRILSFRRSLSLERHKTADKPLERKPTYSSRFMSMFHSKTTDPTVMTLHEKRRVSADHIQEIKRGKFMSMFHSKTSDKSAVLPPDTRKFSADHVLHMDRGRSPSPVPDKPLKPEATSSRFMSMFHSKVPDQAPEDNPPQNIHEVPANQHLQVNTGKPPVKPEGSPSSSRFMGMFKREKVERSEAMSVVEEPSHAGNMSIQKPPEKPLLTVKVTETFSLKVDEMDQYSSHPPKSPSPVRQSRQYASSDHLSQGQDRFNQDGISESIAFSTEPQEPFAPIVLSGSRSSQMHLAASPDRRSYMSTSQADISGSRRSDIHELIPPAPAQIITVGNKKLVSVPIAVPVDFYDSEMTISEFMRDEHENQKNLSQQPRTNLIRAPSEQRLARSKLLQRKTYDRTQSQDRAAADRMSELDSLSLGTRSMTKTVSFNFGEHGSQRDYMDSSSNNQLDKNQWLERTYFSRDHEYEPIGEPTSTEIQKEPTPEPTAQVSILKKESSPAPVMVQEMPKSEEPSVEIISDETPTKSDELKEAEELQKDLEDRYFNSAATTSQPSESQNDYEMQTSQMDSSALEDIPMEAETKKKGFMANAQDRTRRMQAGLKNQAGKIKTKFRSQKKAPSGSPKATTRKRFKAPEFSKIKMPEMKRPEFTKFSKPDMSKFKLPDKFSSLKLNRSKSFKEPSELDDTTVSGTTPESGAATAPPKKQRFDFSFGTYPRAFRKKSKPEVVESTVDEPSVIQSTETQPSAESSSTPQGDRGPGPVRSRWADKFSDVSYNDSEGSRYRRFESEQESSFDRESSMERRMKEVLEDNAKEEAELAMFSVVEQKQFADYDEENRVIHEISKTRERDFKRRPMVHQDSDLVSEEGRDIGWTQREAEKNEFLRKAELEAESHSKNLPERDYHQDAQSTASSKRLVFEEISSDEFLLRKKGASQEFSIGSKQKYVDTNLEAGFEKPVNPLELIGSQSASLNGSSIDRIDYGYDVPPPKPRRLSQQQRQRYRYDSENASQIEDYADDISLSQAGSDYFRHAPPARPLRKGRFRNSQDMSIGGTPSIQYDDEDYSMRDRNFVDEEKENIQEQRNESPMPPAPPPQPPRRRRKQLRDSLEKDSYVNGFGGRSVSNSYLREDNKPEEVIVYRTEHEYKIPLATPENYTDTSVTPRKSKSLSRLGIDEDDRTSRGADSLALDIAMREENDNLNAEELHEKYIIEMMENDGYAVVRKENLPKPTPPARRKKFTRSPGERFATMPHQRKAASPSSLVGEQKISSTGNYSTIGARPIPPTRRSASSLAAPDSQKDYGSQDFTDYEEPELDERPESPRNLQSGDIINKMKYRPLPPPPRPPREKRHFHRDRHGVDDDNDEIESRDDRDDRDGGGERIAYHELHEQSSEDYSPHENVEVEVSTQTDPLPDDFVCEEFEITEDMKIIEPRRTKTLDEILKEEEEAELERAKQIDEEILARGIQRFREASQRSASDRSRASSQAKSLSRPQTPSAILIEKRIPTPVPNANGQTVIEASLTVQPIDDLDLEEELLRKEGLYDGSHSKSDEESRYKEEEKQSSRAASEEENARIDEEVQSYTRSTDAESQQQEETDRESELERERELERELELERERELEHERELEQEREELMFEAERRMQEEEAKREREQEEEANRRLQEEVEADERLLRELEEEQRFLEEALLRHAEKEKELERRIREEEEEEREKRRIAEEQEIEQRLHPDSQSEEHESYDEDQHERLKAEDSSELKSDVSEEKETTPLPSPSATLTPHQLEEEVLVSQVKKLLLEQPPKDESYEREKTLSPPPMAPPRKRSTANEALSVAEQQPMPVPFTGVMPSHLAIADLEVERLRVHALQAGQIMVSHLHGAQIQAEELECRSGNLVVKNIELPPGFIEDIVERVRSTEREHAQASTQTIAEARTQTEEDSIPPPPLPTREPETPPVRPPPPSAAHFLQLRDHDDGSRSVHLTDYHLQTIPPIGFYNHLHTGGDDEEPAAAAPPPVYRRRRHLRRRDSSSEEEHQRRRSRSIRPEQPPQSVAQAGRQFISACSLPLVNIITQLTNALRPNNNDNNKDQVQPRNISTAVVVLIVMALSLVIYLLTGRNIHHHHWDYFNPPGNDGRLS